MCVERVTLFKGCLRAGEGTTWSIGCGCVIGVMSLWDVGEVNTVVGCVSVIEPWLGQKGVCVLDRFVSVGD